MSNAPRKNDGPTPPPMRGPGHGRGPMMGPRKPINKKTAIRLLAYLKPSWPRLLLVLCWTPVWLAFYPGSFSADSLTQFYSYYNEEPYAHHPLLHTAMLGGLMMLGIEIFGMTPFGWRFMGTLLGCLMLPVMYLLTKQLLKKTEYAFLATFLMANANIQKCETNTFRSKICACLFAL